MFVCIILVAVLPVVGFFLYLLIRPARTIKERDLEEMLRSLVDKEKGKEKKEKTVRKKVENGK